MQFSFPRTSVYATRRIQFGPRFKAGRVLRNEAFFGHFDIISSFGLEETTAMAKPHRLIKKANHGSRPANAKARRAKRRKIKT